jgi:hypothetical protein
MTIPISSIVSVSISRQTRAVSSAAFGVPLVLGIHTKFAERIKFVDDMTGVTALGFTSSDTVYKMAAQVFGQTPKPNQVAIGRREANAARTMLLDFSVDLIADNVINGTVNGVAISPITFTSTHANTMSLLEAAVEAIDGVDTATISGNNLSVAFDAGVDGSLSGFTVAGGVSVPVVTITTSTAGKNIASELDLLVVESEGWYQLLIDSQAEVDIKAAAGWVESHNPQKIFSYWTTDTDAKTGATTDVAYKMKALGYTKSFGTYHVGANEFPDCAIIGRMAPEVPGSATFKFKSITGVTADALNQSEVNYLVGKNVNHYVNVGSLDIYKEGVTASGEFIDVIIGAAWIESEIQSRIYTKLVNAKKIPYTDAGVGIITNEVNAVLNEAVIKGILSDNPAPVVTAPLVADISAANKANRLLPDITFTGTLAGAIHKTTISGTITL